MIKQLVNQVLALFAKKTINAAQAWQADHEETPHAFWMYAVPVNMQLGRDSYFLTDPDTCAISTEESQALMNGLNSYFDDGGFKFYLHHGVWFLGLDHHPEITTTPIDQVKNQNIADFLPQGDGALEWNRRQNEIQMFLFSHPVNQAREANGLPVMNSLWCYGLGQAVFKI